MSDATEENNAVNDFGGSLLAGKTGIIMGVANNMSIGWGIAKAAHSHGANFLFTYQAEALESRVRSLANSIGCDNLIECDVTNDDALDKTFDNISKIAPAIDFIVHSIAFSDKNELNGRYLDTSRSNFSNTMDISCYSFAAVIKRAEKLLVGGASLLSLSYYGAEKAVPNYNVMGVAKAALEASVRYLAVDLGSRNIRVNAISAGPIRTLAASGITGFRSFLKTGELVNPLKRNTSLKDIGGAAIYLLSDLSSGTTGEIVHVDCGFHAVGIVGNEDAE
jgi:enoyl-[acyl-carrier protein] reductase I